MSLTIPASCSRRKEAGWLSIFQIPLQNPAREAWKDGKAWSFSFRKSFPSWNEVSEHAGASARLPGGLLWDGNGEMENPSVENGTGIILYFLVIRKRPRLHLTLTSLSIS